MTWDEYRAQVKSDAAEVLEDDWQDGWMGCVDLDDRTIDPSLLEDDLFCEDRVTGNGSGSYTFSRAAAAENVVDVIFTEEFGDMLDSYAMDMRDLFGKGAEAIDVIVRCCLLGEVCWDVAHEFAEAHGFTVAE